MLLPLIAVCCFAVVSLRASETIPPAPRDHFNDYAGIVDPATAQRLDGELTQYERESSNQLLVAIYPRMESDSSVEDYTVRVAQAWHVGVKGRDNGAVLFVFQQSHDVRIQVGYGLEAKLTDALCKRIVEDEIIPRFRAGDFSGGMSAGVRAMIAATRGEYQGTGRTVRDTQRSGGGTPLPFLAIIFVVIMIASAFTRRRNTMYYSRGRRGIWLGGPGGWGGGSGWGGGGGGGGSFSGGGGSFGGGGAGGKW